jgi:hypothetical protein
MLLYVWPVDPLGAEPDPPDGGGPARLALAAVVLVGFLTGWFLSEGDHDAPRTSLGAYCDLRIIDEWDTCNE